MAQYGKSSYDFLTEEDRNEIIYGGITKEGIKNSLFISTGESGLNDLLPNSIYIYGERICSKEELPVLLKGLADTIREKHNMEESERAKCLLLKKFNNNVNFTISTPDYNSFKNSNSQITDELAEKLKNRYK